MVIECAPGYSLLNNTNSSYSQHFCSRPGVFGLLIPKMAPKGVELTPRTMRVVMASKYGRGGQARGPNCPTGAKWCIAIATTRTAAPCTALGVDTHRYRPQIRVNLTYFWVVCGLARPQYAADHRNITHAFAPACLLNVGTIIYIPHLISFRPTGQFRQNTGFGRVSGQRPWSPHLRGF